MNLKQRSSRYSAGVLFTASVAGALLFVAAARHNFVVAFDSWLAGMLVLVLILHARLGFALSRAQTEIEMLKKLALRVDDDIEKETLKVAPVLKADPSAIISAEDTQVLDRVRSAIEGGRVDLYLQPIVSLPQRKTRYYEAFSRLRDADGKILKPTEYLEAAERANRIGVIDNMILLRCVQAFRKLRARDSQFSVFCNVSPATLFDVDFFNQFTDYLAINEELSSRLIFEFTYPALQMMHPRFEKNLELIAERGFAFSVDHIPSLNLDWGYLRQKNVRFVKASSSLLLAAGAKSEAAVVELHGFRKRLADADISLIAEKVENESSMPEILALGIDYGQGNLFGPPRPADIYVKAHEGERRYAEAS
ncbi:MAG: EAL domain-containing protein [Parvularculaceae bacterium]|jgi:cyclic-di-GMP phosphodiesterase TipF (flagellum assembly factor)|nr:EAL domain-containing protein [Parvularculaceae bacterium]